MIKIEPVLFDTQQISKIEKLRNAKYVCASEHKEHIVEIFYSDKPRAVSKSRYFALYYDNDGKLMITNGSFIEDQELQAVIADNGQIIYSRYRHDYVTSDDGSAVIDGGRSYIRTNKPTILLKVKDGILIHVQN